MQITTWYLLLSSGTREGERVPAFRARDNIISEIFGAARADFGWFRKIFRASAAGGGGMAEPLNLT